MVPYSKFNGHQLAINNEIGAIVGDSLLNRRSAHLLANMREKGFICEFIERKRVGGVDVLLYGVTWPDHDGSGPTVIVLEIE